MCILRYRPKIVPSVPMTAVVLWWRPGARRSNREATTTTEPRRASQPKASVLGPGMDSASEKSAASSFWQKYCERKSSGKHTTLAPWLADSRIFAQAVLRLAVGSADIAIWTRATW